MKKVIIKNFTHAEVDAEKETFGFLKIPEPHKIIRAEGIELEVSDSFHTFDELYDHRIALYIALAKGVAYEAKRCRTGLPEVWRSNRHHDSSCFDEWFILGIGKYRGQQITYHIPLKYWDETDFAETLGRAPEWDGHTSADVITRLKNL